MVSHLWLAGTNHWGDMMKKVIGAILVCLFLVGAVTIAAAAEVQLTADLSGSNEVGDPGDPEGTGSATVDIDSDTNEVCFQITFSGTEDPVAAHIHQAASDANGDVVVNFDWENNNSAGCVAGDAAIVSAILADSSGFYVNVHTGEFPAGAIRGQLSEVMAQDMTDGQLALTGAGLTMGLLLAAAGLIVAGGMFQVATVRTRRQ